MFKTKFLKIILITSFIITQSETYSKSTFPRANIENDSTVERFHILSRSFNSSFGLGYLNFRDFATSPLFYIGPMFYFSGGQTYVMPKIELDYKLGFNVYTADAKIPKSSLINADAYSFGLGFDAEVSALYQHPKLIFNKQRVQIGGVGVFTSNIRYNPYLGNNGLAVDNLINLMVSGRIVRDISRTTEKIINLYLFKITLKPLKRDLMFQTDVGVLNINHRPGYAYSYESEVIGTETTPVKWFFDDYKWSLNGWRLRTHLTYKTYHKNGNAQSIACVWEAFSAKGKIEPFQMATHSIRLTRYFSLK
ncbi:MAG TPA: hypothetical protein PLS84_06520 [Salinivirgaceae bacterium]|nr:hypothetical protein [Salinivirgaceae bacterium]